MALRRVLILTSFLMSGLLESEGLIAQGEGGYAGTDTCSICHDTVLTALSQGPHWSAYQMKLPSEESMGCESCHGPGQNHAEDPTQPIFAFKDEPARERVKRCAACHEGRDSRTFHTSVHTRFGQACDACHSSGHGESVFKAASLLKSQEPQLCVSCHAQQGAQMQMPFRHRTSDGVLVCTDCHDPHGRSVRLISSHSRDESCFKCHSDKQGPFMFEHRSVMVTGCASCHEPHGATNPKLLVRSDVRFLCLECHEDTPRFHDLSQDRFQNCTVCHTTIHGSYVDAKFLR